MHTKLIAIVPAAGIGARALDPLAPSKDEVPKQYKTLNGQPMLRRAVQALLADERIGQVRVAVAPEDPWVQSALEGLPRTTYRHCGGATRADTVLQALQDAAPSPGDWVLVHDAARPGLPPDALKRLIDYCLEYDRGALLAQPVADTVKRARDDPHVPVALQGPRSEGDAHHVMVDRSIPREGLWLAQTPQMFRAKELMAALQNSVVSGTTVTDEASAMEMSGYSPALIPGSIRNFKVTWAEDFDLMARWL